MTELIPKGIYPYDLAGSFCSECGRAKINRMLEYPTSCTEYAEVITRHRCKPPEDIALGQPWICPLCDSTWTLNSETVPCPNCCGECGREMTGKKWDYVRGARIGTAPRHKPQPVAPFRNPFPRP